MKSLIATIIVLAIINTSNASYCLDASNGQVVNCAAISDVNLIYLIPTNKQHAQNYENEIEQAIFELQKWYALELQGETFAISNEIVMVVYSDLSETDFQNGVNSIYGAYSLYFWGSVYSEAFRLANVHFNDELNTYAVYVDADPLCGQTGGAGNSGVLIVPANDLRGLAEEQTIKCDGENTNDMPRGRWVGGLGHELGHAFGLPHTPGCGEGDITANNSIMCYGFREYPENVYLRDDERVVAKKSNSIFLTNILIFNNSFENE